MERVVTVVPAAGLHARPASKFVQTANEFDADISVVPLDSDKDPVSARSMLSISGLNVGHGDQIRLIADGPDAKAALDALEEILTTPENNENSDNPNTEGATND